MSTPPELVMAQGGPPAPPTSDPQSFSLEGVNLDENAPDRKAEEDVVAAFFKTFTESRKFDITARQQMAKDRSYASGRALAAWAVSTNVIGSMIDILVAALYARDPDCSVTKSPQVDESNTRDMELFAQTLQIVISKLWKRGKLKKRMRRIIRSLLAVGQGWLKCVMVGQKKPDPIVQGQINSLKANLDAVTELQKRIGSGEDAEGESMSPEELSVAQAQYEAQMATLAEKLEVMVYEGLAIDFVRADDIQVGTDVDVIEEYLDSDTIYHLIYVPKDKVGAKFPRLTPEDIKAATVYYRSAPTGKSDILDAEGNPFNGASTADGEVYTSVAGDARSTPYVRIVECWNRAEGRIYTAVDGVKHWAVDAYPPPYPSSRFYSFFFFSIYEVDDERHPQSLTQREAKLQDEYAATRSNFRISRERSIPGFLFNATQISDEQAKKIANGTREEMIAVKPTNADAPLGNLFIAKPVSQVDPRLYDTSPILMDMERVAGVQEAQTAAITVQKTATEADIQQSGFSARTEAARDGIELVLTELAQYTAECAIGCLSADVVQRMAGAGSFWPEGMAPEDLFTLVEVEIEAGTTGKPKKKTDQAAWGTVLPLITQLQGEIAALMSSVATNPMLAALGKPLIDAKKELLKETMRIAGVDTDLERFLPNMVNPMVAPPAPLPPGTPGTGTEAPLAPEMPPGGGPPGIDSQPAGPAGPIV
jgi:hypothetical protein